VPRLLYDSGIVIGLRMADVDVLVRIAVVEDTLRADTADDVVVGHDTRDAHVGEAAVAACALDENPPPTEARDVDTADPDERELHVSAQAVDEVDPRAVGALRAHDPQAVDPNSGRVTHEDSGRDADDGGQTFAVGADQDRLCRCAAVVTIEKEG